MDDLPGDFRDIAASDTDELFTLFDAAGKRAWCYYAPFLNCYHTPPGRRVMIGTFASSTCVLAITARRKTIINLVVPPIPFDPEATQRLSADIRDRTGTEPRVLWCDEADARIGEGIGYSAEQKELEYFYDPARVAAMEGPGYKELRKRVHRAERRYQPTFREMTKDDVPACHDLLKRWRRLQGRKHDFLLDWGYTRAALDRFGDWSVQDLAGWCVMVDDRVAAFGMAGRMAADQACFFIAKSDPALPDLAEYLRVGVYGALDAYRLVNDAGDLDLPGLRQHKRRFRPVDQRPVFTLKR